MMGYGFHGVGMGGFGLLFVGMAFKFAFLLIIVGLIIYLFRRFRHGGYARHPREERMHATEILAERFARGEITEEEYRRMKEVLK